MVLRKNMKIIIKKTLPAILVIPLLLLAHGGESHENSMSSKQVITVEPTDLVKEQYAQINKAYLTTVKPIFKAKCFDCHSDQTKFPIYYNIPGVKQFIDKDIKDAQKHLNLNSNFPFISHETPFKDLKSIAEEIEEGEMPPLKYKIIHWSAFITDTEKQTILNWTQESIKLLKEKK